MMSACILSVYVSVCVCVCVCLKEVGLVGWLVTCGVLCCCCCCCCVVVVCVCVCVFGRGYW